MSKSSAAAIVLTYLAHKRNELDTIHNYLLNKQNEIYNCYNSPSNQMTISCMPTSVQRETDLIVEIKHALGVMGLTCQLQEHKISQQWNLKMCCKVSHIWSPILLAVSNELPERLSLQRDFLLDRIWRGCSPSLHARPSPWASSTRESTEDQEWYPVEKMTPNQTSSTESVEGKE